MRLSPRNDEKKIMSILFSTTQDSALAKNVARQAKQRPGKYTPGQFADGEHYVTLKEEVTDEHIIAFGSTNPPAENIIELLVLIHSLKVHGARSITAVIPYFGYAKADHIDPFAGTMAAELMAKLVEAAGATKILTIELHSRRVGKFFSIPLVKLSALPLLAADVKKLKLGKVAVVSPDLGGVERAKQFADLIGIREIVTVSKYRPGIDQAVVRNISGEVKDKTAIIVDDMVQTGGTIIKAAAAPKARGAKQVICAVTHLVPSAPGIKNLTAAKFISKIITTNSLPLPKLPTKFTVVKIDGLLASSIK